MALTSQDLVHGTDFTAINPITAGDLNNLVDISAPFLDTNGDGKGLIILSHDTALDTPYVPSPLTYAKWKRYIWLRIPHSTATDKTPRIYAWNDNAVSDVTLLKWIQLLVDITALTVLVNSALAQAQAAAGTANTALFTANLANAAAGSALIAANNAEADAGVAANNAAAANAAAIAAQSSATAATNIANAALAAANATHAVSAILAPGTAGQHIRTNSAATLVEWYDEIKQYIKVSYSPAKNTAAQVATANDWTQRHIDTEDSDLGNLVSIAADVLTFNTPGIYKVNIVCPMNTTKQHKAVLIDNDTGLVLLTGSNAGVISGTSIESASIINGLITITGVIKNLAIMHFCSVAGDLGSSNPVNIDYPKAAGIATKEVYMVAEFTKIN